MVKFTKEWINSIPKIINSSGCWIPTQWKSNYGYITIALNNKDYKLHRIVMCVYHDIDYDNPKIDTRHAKDCIKACFNSEHLQPGSHADNMKDSILHGTNRESQKECCPKCGGSYRRYKRRKFGKVTWNRYCPICRKK